MDQELNNLLFQYAVAKGILSRPYDDDDFLILGELAASIADVYRCKRGGTFDSVKAWSDISEEHLSHVSRGSEEQNQQRKISQTALDLIP